MFTFNRIYTLWGLLILLSVWLMFRLSVPYIHFEKHVDFLLTKQKVYHIDYWRISFYIHVFTGVFVLPAGLTQFYPRFISHTLHRFMGKWYVIVVLFLTAPSGLLMGIHANGGGISQASFICLSLAWWITTAMAWRRVKQGRWVAHGEWMLYSYALTLSAITFRFYALMLDILHLGIRPPDAYVLLTWTSWVPNLLIAACLIRMGLVRKIMA